MGAVLRQLVISHVPQRMMFAGAEEGFIRSLKFPLTGELQDYMAHSGPITRLRLTFDDRYLLSCGEDGCLTVFEIREKAGRMPAKRTKDMTWSEEVLVTISDLEEKKMLESELRNKVDELQLHNEYQLRLREMHYQDTLKEKTDRFQKELHAQKQTYEVLRDEKQDMEMEYEEKVKLKEDKHAESVQNCEAEHQRGLMEEVEGYHELEHTLQDDERAWEGNTLDKEEVHRDQHEQLQETEADRLEEKVVYREMLDQQKEELVREYGETRNQMEDDMDTEIEELKRKNDRILQDERDATLRLKGENGVMRKKFITLKNEIEEQKEEARRMAEQEQTLRGQIGSLNEEITLKNQHMGERDRAIAVREKKVMELKKRNQSLEKHKYVLDHNIKRLKRQIEPRQNKITEMRALVKQLDGRLETMHKDNRTLQSEIHTHSSELGEVHALIVQKRDRQCFLRNRISEFARDLYVVVQHIQEPEELKEAAQKLYDTHMKGSLDKVAVDPDVANEYERQKQHLRTSVDEMAGKLQAMQKSNRSEYLKILQQNMELINEANAFRGQLKAMEQQVAAGKNDPAPQKDAAWKRELQIQRDQMAQLEDELTQLERSGVSRTPSNASIRAVSR